MQVSDQGFFAFNSRFIKNFARLAGGAVNVYQGSPLALRAQGNLGPYTDIEYKLLKVMTAQGRLRVASE